MAATQPPPGSRGNGLSAGGWTTVADCDPRVADELLALLADAAIAACAAPSPGERGGYLEVRLPRRPIDRLYVDAARRIDAEALVRRRLAEPLGQLTGSASRSANDEAFDAIVAGWSSDGATTPWPSAEDVPEPAPPEVPRVPRLRRRTDPAPPPPLPPSQQPGLLDPGGLLYDSPIGEGTPDPDADPFEGDDNHFEPPPAPPTPPLRVATKGAWLAILFGVFCLLAPAFGWFDDAQAADVLGGLLVLGGVGSLVYHLHDDPRDDDPDDGAVV